MGLRMKHHLGLASHELRYEPTALRLRADVGGETVVDTVDALIVWEPRRVVPVYAVPPGAIAGGIRDTDPQPEPADLDSLPPLLGPMNFELHTCPGRVVDVGPVAAAGFVPDDPDLGGRVLLDFAGFDSWRAEDDELVGHAHDPFKTIEVWNSGRHVEVSVGGVVLAETIRPRMLLETHLPTRWYIPLEDVRTDVLVPSDHRSTCAYKGHASYFSTADGSEEGQDIGWTYKDPLHAAEPVRDMVCFWAERTDVVLDGVPQDRPITPWSRPEEQRDADPDRLEFG
jgi:uncharacterized protein (DUF427 family)